MGIHDEKGPIIAKKKSELEKWFQKYGATKILYKRLTTSLDLFCSQRLEKNQREAFMIVNLTVIRDCLRDCGLE